MGIGRKSEILKKIFMLGVFPPQVPTTPDVDGSARAQPSTEPPPTVRLGFGPTHSCRDPKKVLLPLDNMGGKAT